MVVAASQDTSIARVQACNCPSALWGVPTAWFVVGQPLDWRNHQLRRSLAVMLVPAWVRCRLLMKGSATPAGSEFWTPNNVVDRPPQALALHGGSFDYLLEKVCCRPHPAGPPLVDDGWL
jgi:hypothetical protein